MCVIHKLMWEDFVKIAICHVLFPFLHLVRISVIFPPNLIDRISCRYHESTKTREHLISQKLQMRHRVGGVKISTNWSTFVCQIGNLKRKYVFPSSVDDKPASVFIISVYKKNVVIFTSKFIKTTQFLFL